MNLPTQCPFCSHHNPRGARFCNECGSPLHLAPCEHCDAVNEIDTRACYRCGAALHRAPADASIPIEVTGAGRDSGGEELRPLADVPEALAKLLRESGERGLAATATRSARLAIPAASANARAAGTPVVAGSAFESAMRLAEVETAVEKIAPSSFADEPSHSISCDIDVDALDPSPSRRRRRSAMPTALAAIVLLVTATAVVGYVALRNGLLPWSGAPAAIATPEASDEAAAKAPASTPSEAPTPEATPATAPAEGSPTEATTPETSAAGTGEAPPTTVPAVTAPPAPEDASTSSAEAANVDPPASSSDANNAAAPTPRRASATKADTGVDKDAAATQSIIQRETGGFGPPKPLPPRAPPAPR